MLVVEVVIHRGVPLEEDTALHEEVQELCVLRHPRASMVAEEEWDPDISRLDEASAALHQVMTTASVVKAHHVVSRLHMEPRPHSSRQCRSVKLLR